MWHAILVTFSEPIERTSWFFFLLPDDLVRNLILNHSIISWYFISLEIGLVSFQFSTFRHEKYNRYVSNDLARESY